MTHQLDVRPEPAARHHQLFFETWGALGAGESFDLVKDHDPKPRYCQLAAERAGESESQSVGEGPEVWRVRIGRTVS